MKYVLIGLTLLLVGCSGSSPTAPTPPPVVFQPPAVVVTPTPTPTPVPTPTPTPNPLLSDPRFDLGFYRKFVLDGWENPNVLQPLQRQVAAPSVYLFTVDQAGASLDVRLLDSAAAALIAATGTMTGAFGLEGIERGTGATSDKPNRITISWSPDAASTSCGVTSGSGKAIIFYYRVAACQCGVLLRPRTIKHEMGHALGFRHTGDAQDLMSGLQDTRCDQDPSPREVFHARIAYGQPIGSLDPH